MGLRGRNNGQALAGEARKVVNLSYPTTTTTTTSSTSTTGSKTPTAPGSARPVLFNVLDELSHGH